MKTKQMRIHGFALFLFCLSCLCPWRGAAALIAADAFPIEGNGYKADQIVFGQQSASSVGFKGGPDGVWAGGNTALWKIVDRNLKMGGVANGGGSLQFNGFASSSYSRAISRTFASSGGQAVLWFGGLFQGTAKGLAPGTKAMVGFLSGKLPQVQVPSADGALWSDANGPELAGVAWGVVDGRVAVDYQANADGARSVVHADTGIALKPGATYYIVGEMRVNADGDKEALNLWVLTAAPASAEGLGPAHWSVRTADIVQNSGALTTLEGYGGVAQEAAPASAIVHFDAIGLGSAYADLLEIPAPAAAAN